LSQQHRRTQNRIAQRAYRQRREEERQKLEDEVKVWKDKCKELDETCKELYVVVDMLKDHMEKVGEESDTLRTAIFSITQRRACETHLECIDARCSQASGGVAS
jgi:predicted nuclease with TOPRIM domain